MNMLTMTRNFDSFNTFYLNDEEDEVIIIIFETSNPVIIYQCQ